MPKHRDQPFVQSKTWHCALMESAYDPIFIADAKTGMLVDANKKALEMTGRSIEEIRHLHQSELHPEDERERARKYFEEMVFRGSGLARDLHVLTRDARRVPVEISTNVVSVGGKRVIQGIFRDITERRRYEGALRKSEDRFRKYFELPLVGIAITSPDLRWIVVNDKLCSILGYARHELGRLTWADLTPPEDLEAAQVTFAKVLGGELNGKTIAHRFARCDGVVIDVEISAQCVMKEDGVIDYLLAVVHDVTERKRSEAALRASETNYRAIFNSVNDGIIVHEPDSGKALDANERACEMYGYTREEFRNVTLEGRIAGVPPFTIDAAQRHVAEALKGTPQMFEWLAKKRNGQLFWIEVNLRLAQVGGVNRLLAIVRDISERKQAEQDRELLEQQLRQAQKIESIGRLAGGIAHDFNNLLTPILGYSEIAMMGIPEGDRRRGDLEQIRNAALRAKALTEQLLAFSRKQVLDMQTVNLNAALADFEKMLQRLIGEDIEVATYLDPGLGSVRTDLSQFQQIVINLAVNARDAMPNGGKLVIETSNVTLDEDYAKLHAGMKPGRYVMLAISDTGHGMDAEVLSHVFEPFFTTKEKGKGTGLGLATVYGIVQQHGGSIWVYSERGKGTTFKIYLPRVDAVPEAQAPGKTERKGSRGRETILVVEDDKMVRDLAADVLGTHGYKVICASSGEEALQMAARRKSVIHLLLTDVIMPNMNGKQLYEKLSAARPGLKVLYMSGYTGNVIVHHGVLDSGVRFVQKPFAVHELTSKVRDALEG